MAQKQFTSLGNVAYIFMVIFTVIGAFALLPMAWMIPMTIHYKKTFGKVGVGFKVCALLFCGLIPGILMLCDNDNK